MALIKFELTEQHIILCKNLDLAKFFKMKSNSNQDLIKDEVYAEFGLILFGKPDGEFDPTSTEEPDWSDEQKETMDKMYDEVENALSVMLSFGDFEEGKTYTRKHYLKVWNKPK